MRIKKRQMIANALCIKCQEIWVRQLTHICIKAVEVIEDTGSFCKHSLMEGFRMIQIEPCHEYSDI